MKVVHLSLRLSESEAATLARWSAADPEGRGKSWILRRLIREEEHREREREFERSRRERDGAGRA